MIGYSVPRGTGGTGGCAPENKALKAKARPPGSGGSDLGVYPLEQGGLQWGLQHGTGALIKIPCSILIGWRSLILPSTVRLGSAHRTIPAKIFVENLNCPDLTASFLAGAKIFGESRRRPVFFFRHCSTLGVVVNSRSG